MGDKSPKSKERQKKQAEAEKNRKKADAYNKAHPTAAVPAGKDK